MRNLARAAATAALTMSAVVIPLTGTATAAPAQATRAVHYNHDDDCDDYRYGYSHNSWDRYRIRRDDDCRYRGDRRSHRSHWRNGHWRHHDHGDCWWNYGHRHY